MKKKKIIIILISVIVLLILFLIISHLFSLNNQEITKKESLIVIQKEMEQKLTSTGYTIDEPNVVLNPYGSSPLSALIMFETEEKVAPKVTIKGKDKWTTFTHTFSENTIHYLPIYGLYPEKENEVIIEYNNTKKTISIKTDKLPDNMVLPESIKAVKEELGNELYFFTPSSIGYTVAYDINGDVRWYLNTYALWKIDRLENNHLLVSTERLINNPYYMTGLYEIDLLGKIYNEYSLEGGYHHDYFEMDNGNLIVASDNFNDSAGTVEDYIVEIDRKTGNIIKNWDLKDILNMTDGQSENWTDYDWFHNNSVWYDKKTNSITLSGRHQDAVINIDYETGALNWIIGDPTNWSEEYQKYFFTPVDKDLEWQWSQHAAMITPEGYVFIFDNGNNKSKIKEEYVDATKSYSRGVMYKINTTNMTIETVFQYGKERGSSFYSPYISDVDYINKDHYIIHSGGIVYVDNKNSNYPAGLTSASKLVSDTVEIKNNKVIFEIKLPTNNYRVEKMSLYGATENFELTNANYLGTLGTTKVDKVTFGPIFSSNNEEVLKQHEIEVTKEQDRLVIKGRFTRGNDVNIILYQNLSSKYYHLPISKKPYTALCVDVFTEEENESGIVVTKYINQDNLKGKYSIYLEINGKIYSTGKYVNYE